MADFEKKEKYEGVWNGENIKFTRVWCGHRFSDDECRRLCNGEEIEVRGLKSAKGNTYGVTGRLSKQSYNGHEFVGFERTGFAERGVPDAWCQHKFTEDEKTMLEAGKTVQLDGCVNKAGNIFSCKVRYGKGDDGKMRIIPEFGK